VDADTDVVLERFQVVWPPEHADVQPHPSDRER
jgi:hypothetical protein